MPNKHSLLNSHLDLAHHYWKIHLNPGDAVIDATCGNGYDTAFLASLVLSNNEGLVFAYDIQKTAIENTKIHLDKIFNKEQLSCIQLIQSCHSNFFKSSNHPNIRCIAYNLGYLPGGNKKLTTKTSSTLESISNALSLIAPGGIISITCYPGHAEGFIETEYIQQTISKLPSQKWSCCHHSWPNRPKSPQLFLLQKKSSHES